MCSNQVGLFLSGNDLTDLVERSDEVIGSEMRV